MDLENINNNLLKTLGLLKDVSGQNGQTKYWYSVKTNLPTFKKDTVDVTVLSPKGQTYIDNLSTPSINKSNWREYVHEENDSTSQWLGIPQNFSSNLELLKTRDKVRNIIKEEKCGGKVKKGESGIKTPQTTPEKENYAVRKTVVQTLPAQGKYIPTLRDSMVYYTRPDGEEYFIEYINGKPFYETDVRNGVGRGINHDLNSNKSDTTYYNWNIPVHWEIPQENLKRAYNGSPQPRYQFIGIKKHGGRLMRQGGRIIEIPFENNK